jgi:hypothetical protein
MQKEVLYVLETSTQSANDVRAAFAAATTTLTTLHSHVHYHTISRSWLETAV